MKIQSLRFIIITLTMMWVVTGNCQTRCNVIQSRYYDRILSIKLQELSDKDCFQSYKTIFLDCGLDNSVLYRELQNFAVLSLQSRDFKYAEQSIRQLITNYGYKIADFKQYENYNLFRKYIRQRGIKKELYNIERNFVSDTSAYIFLKELGENDQSVRIEYINAVENCQQDTLQTKIVKEKYAHLLDSIDMCNCKKILNYYDTASQIILSQEHRQTIFFSVLPLMTHCARTSFYHDLCAVLRKGIEGNIVPPEFLAAIVDRYQLNNGLKYIYGFYDNLSESSIEDIRNLDNRRFAIGLPSYYVEKQWKEKLKYQK